MAQVTKKQFVSSAFWKILEQFLSKGVSLLISILLARILQPSVFGLIALTAIFTNLSDILVDGGFSTALISKKEVDDVDYSNSLFVSFGTSTVLYLITFFIAPVIAGYYNEALLTALLRVIGITFFIQAFAATRTAVVTRQMKFRTLFICNLVSTIISGAIGIAFAYILVHSNPDNPEVGVWAIVIQRLSQQAILTIILFIAIRWKLKFKVDFKRMKALLFASLGIVTASLINFAASSIYSLVIAKIYSVTDLGYYDKGPSLVMQISLYLFGAITSVLLPTLVSYKGDKVQIKAIVRRVVSLTAFMLAPMMVGMAAVAEELIVVLYTDTWMPMLRIMQYSCIYYFATPFMLINVQVFLALGHTAMRIKTELIRFALMMIGLFGFAVGLKCDINQLCLVSAVIAVLAALISFFDVWKMLNYNIFEALSDIALPLIISLTMGLIILRTGELGLLHFGFEMVTLNYLFALLIKVAFGIIFYFAIARLLRIPGYDEIFNVLKSYMHKGAKKEEANA